MLNIGDKAPVEIQSTGLDENKTSLNEFSGKYIVLYFYPKDQTPGCTTQACSFRDFNGEIEALGAKVIGVSKDSVESHKKFIAKQDINFDLWSDPDAKLMTAFGTWQEKSMFGKKYFGTTRSTFIISPNGKIAKVWPKAKPATQGEEIVAALKELQGLK